MTTKPKRDLTALAKLANAAHKACEKAARSMLQHARECGDTLLRVKKALPHGEFTPWIRDNCQFKARMARAYMLIARNWNKLVAKRQRAADLDLDSLSMREALRLLAAGGPEEDEVLADRFCPSCGSNLVQTSKLWATCPECWDCRLFGSVPAKRAKTRTVKDFVQTVKRLAHKIDPVQRAELIAILGRMQLK